MPPKKKSGKKKGKRNSNGRKEQRQNGNAFHSTVNDISKATADATLGAEAYALLQKLQTPRPINETSKTVSKLVSLVGTDISQNERDPYGNGDQSGCGEMGLKGDPTRQILRSLFSEGGDLDSYLCYDGFSKFALACGTGNISVVKEMLEETNFGSEERMHLLERRETGMRFAPLCLTVALYKAKSHVSMRLMTPVSQMNHMAVFKLLLRYGAVPDCKELTGKTIAHYAAGSFANEDTLKMADMCIEAAKSSLYFGKDIILRNLSKAEYNGQEGKLGGYFADSGRREVILKKGGKQLSLHPRNLFVKIQDQDQVGEAAVEVVEKSVYNDERKLVNDQDRVGMISLHEVFMSSRVDVARFLTEKHHASIDIEDRGNISIRRLAYSSSSIVSEMSNVIRKYGTQHTGNKKKCVLCGKSDRDTKLFQCARCKVVQYCSKECQKVHWKKEHKYSCAIKRSNAPVKVRRPAANKHVPMGPDGSLEKLNFGRPDGIKLDEKFLIKVQISSTSFEGMEDIYPNGPHKIYDKSRTCHFYINDGEPGYTEIRERVKSENAYMGRKSYFKALFGNDGNCAIFLDETALKNW